MSEASQKNIIMPPLKLLLLFPFRTLRFGNIFLCTYVVAVILLTHCVFREGQGPISAVLTKAKVNGTLGSDAALAIYWLYQLLDVALTLVLSFVAFNLPIHVQWYTDQRLVIEFLKYTGPAARKTLETSALALTASIFYLVPLLAFTVLYHFGVKENLSPTGRDIFVGFLWLVLCSTAVKAAPLVLAPWIVILGWMDPAYAVRESPTIVGKQGVKLLGLLAAGIASATLVYLAIDYLTPDTVEYRMVASFTSLLALWYWNTALCAALLTLLEQHKANAER
jgi:hypothetical protein